MLANDPKKLLLVEDEILIAMNEKLILEKYGYTVATVGTGEKAVEAIKGGEAFDLVLMDIDLGRGIDGPTTAMEILKDRSIPIVFLSSHTEPEIVETTERITSYGYVVKNSGITVLEASIKMAFKLFEAHEKLTDELSDRLRAETALRESEARYRRITESVTDYIFTAYVENGEVVATVHGAACVAITGYSTEEFASDPYLWFNMIIPEDRERVESHAARIVRDGEIGTVIHRIVRKDGTVRWISNTPIPHRGPDGGLESYDGLIKDITENQRAEEILRESEATLRAIFDTAGTGFLIIDKDTQIILASNKSVAEMTGMPKEKIVGQICHALICPAEAGKCPVKDLHQDIDHSERKLLCADGSQKDILKTVRPIIYGSRNCYLESFIDISDLSEKRVREEESRKANEFLEDLFNHANAPIVVWDSELKITRVNHVFETLSGRSAAELLGKTPEFLFPSDRLQASMALIRKTLTRERWDAVDIDIQNADGSIRTVLWNSSTLFSADRKTLIATIVQGQDITERKLAEEKLRVNEERLRIALDASADAVWDWDLVTGDAYFSPRWYELLGYDPDQIQKTAKQWVALAHPDDRDAALKTIRQAVADGANYKVEFRTKHSDGHWVWCLVKGKVTGRDQTGKPIRISGTNSDITERKRTEDSLRESNEKLNDAQKMAHVGFWEWEAETDTVTWSEEMYRIAGLGPENKAPSYAEHPSLYTPDSWQTLRAAVERALKTHESYLLELELIRSDASIRCVNAYGGVKRGGDGKAIGLYGIVQDITERKQTENALKESEARLREVLENSMDASYKRNLHTKAYDYLSPVFNRLSGYTSEEMRNLPLEVVMGLIHPGDAIKIENAIALAISGPIGSAHKVEYRFKHKDGSYRWFCDQFTILRNSSGEAVSLIGSVSDITERKRTEETLKESEEQYRRLFENASLGVFQSTPQGKAISVNPAFARMFGYESPQDAIRSIRNVAADLFADPKRREELLRLMAERPDIKKFENLYRRKDGSTFVGDLSPLPIKDENGHLVRMEGIIEDITERKLAGDKVEKLLAEKELILKEVHHRIKNNMNTIYGLLMLQAGTAKDPIVTAALEEAGNRVKSMVTLYDKLYRSDFSMATSVVQYLPFLVDDVIASYLNGKSVKVEKRIDDFALDVKVLMPLGIIVNELLSNIMKYAFTGRNSGRIVVEARVGTAPAGKNRVSVIIQDDGIGIPETVDFNHTSGFGLMLVGGLTEQLGGAIRIERGNGTRIVLEFDA